MGIGEKGRTLKEMLIDNECLFTETGHYAGIKELTLKEQDPLKFEIFHSRILAALIAARETTRMISGSPIVREVAELCCGLYTPEGDNVAQSTGIQVHIKCMGDVIRWMIRHDYEEEVGIAEGDIFTCNDNAIAGMHPADVYDLIPIFCEGELLGWAATVIMETEIGAISPGCIPAANTERFTDGFRVCAEKTGTNDKLRVDFEHRVRFQTRMSDLFLLDRRGAVAANIRIREEVKEIIKEFGIEYFRGAIRELIEDERQGQLSRARTRTVPGRYRNSFCGEFYMSRLPVLPYAQKDQIVLVPINFTIDREGKFIIDYDGAGPWGWHSMNCSPSGMSGGLSIAMVQSIAYTGKANEGTLLATETHCPYDTFLNPTSIFVPTGAIWFACINGLGLWLSLLSRAFFARGFREEIFLSGGAPSALELSGTDHYGKSPFGGLVLELGGTMGSGARGIMDGIDNSYGIWNPEADAGNFEVWELLIPALQIGRNFIPDSCGYGKYRSGYSLCSTFLLYKTPNLMYDTAPLYCHDKIVLNSSIFGGYPGAIMYSYHVRGANTKELIQQRKPLPHEEGDPREPNMKKLVRGDFRVVKALYVSDELQEGDIIQFPYRGSAGGYGDPLERDPAVIKKDLDNGLATIESCCKIYGIEAYYDEKAKEWVIDPEKTRERRNNLRKERLQRARPVQEWWQEEREKVEHKRLEPLLMSMYNGSLKKGQNWPQEFRSFWQLPNDFIF